MSESNSNISSLAEDSAESYLSCGSEAVKMQNIECENERLKQVNSQLETLTDSLKKQLKDAVDSSMIFKSSNQSVKILKQQITDLTIKSEKLVHQIKDLKASLKDKDVEIENLTSKNEVNIKILETKYNKIESQNKKLKEEIKKEREDIIQKEDLLQLLTEKYKKKSTSEKKMKEKFDQIINENKTLNDKLQTATQKEKFLENEIQNINDRLTESISSSNELNIQISMKNNEISELKKAALITSSSYSILEGQLEDQRREIEEIAQERFKLVDLTATLQKAMTKATDIIHDLKLEKSFSSPAKARALPKLSNAIAENDILDIKLPFEGELQDDLEKILVLPQYQPMQKIQLIINELSKNIKETEEEMRELKNREIVTVDKSDDKYASLLSAFLSELSGIVSDFNLAESQQSIKDKKFIQFLSSKLAEIDPILKSNVTNESNYIPNNFFSTNNNWVKQMEAIEEISNKEKLSYAIIVSQFLLNKILREEVNKVNENKEEGSEVKPNIEERAIVEEPRENSSVVSQLNMQISNLEDEKKKLKKALKSTKERLLNVNQVDNEHQTEIVKLKIELNSTKNELDVCKMKLDISSSKLSSTMEQPTIVGSSKDLVDELNEGTEDDVEVSKIKTDLETKNHELEKLKKENEKLNEKITQLTKHYQKQVKKINDKFNQEKTEILNTFDDFKTRNIKIIKANNKKSKKEKAQDNNTISDLSTKLDSANNELSRAMRDIQQKKEEIEQVKTNYNNTIKELNAKISSLDCNINELINQKKQFEIELTNIKQQSVKEKQNVQCQLSAQTMAYQTKIQQMQQEMNLKIHNTMQKVYSIVQDNLGQMYGLEQSDLNEDTLKQLVVVVKNDLDKLKYFQEEATHFTSN